MAERNPDRIDRVLAALTAFWKKNPDLRLGQIMCMASSLKTGTRDPLLMEEDELLAWLQDKLRGGNGYVPPRQCTAVASSATCI